MIAEPARLVSLAGQDRHAATDIARKRLDLLEWCSKIQIIHQHPPSHVDSDKAAKRTNQEAPHQPETQIITDTPADIAAKRHSDEHEQPIHGLAPRHCM